MIPNEQYAIVFRHYTVYIHYSSIIFSSFCRSLFLLFNKIFIISSCFIQPVSFLPFSLIWAIWKANLSFSLLSFINSFTFNSGSLYAYVTISLFPFNIAIPFTSYFPAGLIDVTPISPCSPFPWLFSEYFIPFSNSNVSPNFSSFIAFLILIFSFCNLSFSRVASDTYKSFLNLSFSFILFV